MLPLTVRSRKVKLVRRVVDGRESAHVGLRDSLGLKPPEQDVHELRSDECANRFALGASNVRPERLRAVIRGKRFEQPPPACGINRWSSLTKTRSFSLGATYFKYGESGALFIAKLFCLETR